MNIGIIGTGRAATTLAEHSRAAPAARSISAWSPPDLGTLAALIPAHPREIVPAATLTLARGGGGDQRAARPGRLGGRDRRVFTFVSTPRCLVRCPLS